MELATSPGFLRADLFEPVEGVQEDTVVVLAFDTRANLDRWLASDERRRILEQMEQYTEGDRTVNVVGGFAGWFDSMGGAQVKKWKSTVAVLLALIPTSLAFTAIRLALFPDLHPALATVLGNIVGIVVLTWLLMPIDHPPPRPLAAAGVSAHGSLCTGDRALTVQRRGRGEHMIEWSDEQRQMQAAVREFVQKEVVPRRDELEHGDLAPYDVLRSYVRTFGIDEMARERFERETGGPPFTTEERYDRAVLTLLPMVEFCRHCPGLMTAMGVSMNLAGNAVKRGTPEQRERWALPLLTLEKVGAWAITEPDSGSDAFGGHALDRPCATATRSCSTAPRRSSRTARSPTRRCSSASSTTATTPPRERRVLSFVLDRGMPGFEQSPPLRKMGLHSSPTGQLFLDDVEVGIDRLIGGAASLGDGARDEARPASRTAPTRGGPARRPAPRSPRSGRASRRWRSGSSSSASTSPSTTPAPASSSAARSATSS